MASGALGDDEALAAIRQLVPLDTLFRALVKKAWLENLHEAFMLRADENELSVCFDCAPSDCINILRLNRVHGVARLAVEDITTLELSVRPDEPNHALIEGILHKEENADKAEWLASQLAAAAAIVDRTRRERPRE